jgi:hypothetical protein
MLGGGGNQGVPDQVFGASLPSREHEERTKGGSHFDFSVIQEINRINLQPNEILMFRMKRPLTDLELDIMDDWVEKSGIAKERVLIIGPDFEEVVAITIQGDDEEQ